LSKGPRRFGPAPIYLRFASASVRWFTFKPTQLQWIAGGERAAVDAQVPLGPQQVAR